MSDPILDMGQPLSRNLGHRRVKKALIVSTIVALLLAIGHLRWLADSTTTQSLSPDEAYRVHLVESRPNLPLKLDRNFRVVLASLDKDDKHEITRETVFTSPDEGRPIGSERFIWSKDSEYVLLVGKRFLVATDLPLGHGEQAYFLYHLPSKRSWTNAKQGSGKHGKLTEYELRQIDFAQPVALREPGNKPRVDPTAERSESNGPWPPPGSLGQ